MMKNTVYEEIASRVLEALEQGNVPWRKPWAGGGSPKNLISKKPYRGINTVLLGIAPFGSPYWVTYKQAKSLGGFVKKGEKGTQIVFWKFSSKDVENEDGEMETRRFALARMYTVFNVEQTTIPASKIPVTAENEHDPIEEAENVILNWEKKPEINYVKGSERAAYSPTKDVVTMPVLSQFESPEAFYGTLFHELVHATGHKSRFDRFENGTVSPSKEEYSKEELVAELGSMFILGNLGIKIDYTNSEAYIRSWASYVKDNKAEVIRAASAAQKAADMILGVEFASEENDD